MEKRQFGKTGMSVSVLGFGGAEIGFNNVGQTEVEKLLHSALDAGLNVIDTAECYAGSEEMIGKCIAGRRDEFHLFTKVGHDGDYTKDDWSAAGIEKNIESSLRKLRTDCLDLIQLHTCNGEVLRKGECIEALEKAKQAGKTRFIGYSGDGEDALYAIGTGRFDTLQTSVNIADQESVELTIPEASRRGMGVIAKRPIANAAWRSKDKPGDDYSKPYWERLKQLEYDFLNGDMDESVAVALRFTLSIPGLHTAIVGTTRPGRWQSNAQLVSRGGLPANQMDAIRARWKSVANQDWVGQT